MKLKSFYVLIGAALVTLGAANPMAAQYEYETPEYQPDRGYDWPDRIKVNEIDPEDAYTEWRRIGRRRAGIPCPSVQGWNVKPLLEERCGVKPRDRALVSKRRLDRYCVYTATTNPPAKFLKPPGLEAVERDRMALAASGNLDQKVAPDMAEKFLQEAGATFSDLQLKAEAGSPTVRLTFIDSQPTQEGLPDQPPVGSAHGYTLMRLASKLVCTVPQRCAAKLASRRALSYHRFELGEAPSGEGGHLGTISDLAKAIEDEVALWQSTASSTHLILNISLGWDGEEDLVPSDPAVQAVYDALNEAAEQGVLVIAAAGNRRGGPNHSNWPLLPAAWEVRHPLNLLGRKLVYAVGGVDWQGVPLFNSRQGGFPRRVAYGDHAVASLPVLPNQPYTQPYTSIYTGTSVSATVVSSAAAMIWHLRPELTARQVMRLIGHSGDPLEARADFYRWRDLWPISLIWPAPEAKRVSVCAAVKHACESDGVDCPSLEQPLSCPRWDRQPAPLAKLFPDADSTPKAYAPGSLPPELTPPCNSGTQVMTENGTAIEDPCPTDQYGSVTGQRWVFPQPPEDPCPGCVMFPPPPWRNTLASEPSEEEEDPEGPKYYNLRLEINGNWQGTLPEGAVLQSATLDIDRFVNGQLFKRMTYPIPFSTSTNPPTVMEMTGLGDGESLFGCRAQINFVVKLPDNSLASLQNTVIVDP